MVPQLQDDRRSEKILIIHSGGIGDLLLALPAMRVFRRAFPHSALELLGRPERLSLVFHDLQAISIHSIDLAGIAYLYLEGAALPFSLSAFFSSFRAVLVFGKAGGKILAENLKKSGVSRVIFLSSFPPEGLEIHVSDYLVESLGNAGISGEKVFAPLRLQEEGVSFARDFRVRHGLKTGEPILAIHPGSGSPAKNWNPINFGEVADWASEKCQVLLISGPADDGLDEVKRAMKKARPIIANHLPLIRLAWVLKSCMAYLGNDSGITHLAAALGIPTVAIFGPTNPAVWGPKGPQVKIIYGKGFCSPEDRSEHDARGLGNIKPNQAIEVLASFVGGGVTPPLLENKGEINS